MSATATAVAPHAAEASHAVTTVSSPVEEKNAGSHEDEEKAATATAPPEPNEDDADADADDDANGTAAQTSSSPADAAERRRLANKRKKDKAKQRKQLIKQQQPTPPTAASSSAFPSSSMPSSSPPSLLSSAEVQSLSSSFPTLSMHRFFTPPLQLAFNPQKGRHVVTAGPLPAGTVAFTLAPYAAVVRDEVVSSICHRCFVSSNVLLKCSQCHHAHYCSPTCRNSHARLHEKECGVMKVIGRTMAHGDSTGVRLMVRVLVQRTDEQAALDKHAEKLKKFSKTKQPASSLSSSLQPGLTYQDVISLQSHEDALPAQHRLELLSILSDFAPILTPLLPPSPTPSTPLLLTLLCLIHTNAHHITNNSKDKLGLGLYTAAALMNHSCQPSCCYHFVERGAMVMTTVRDIGTGDELTYAYCDAYQSRPQRWAVLRDVYKMPRCDCERCVVPMADSWDRFIDALQCNRCRQDLLRIDEPNSTDTVTCPHCSRAFTSAELREYEQDAELIAQQALSLHSSRQHELVASTLQSRLLDPPVSSSPLRPHPYSFLSFQTYFLLLPALSALSQHSAVVDYCQLALHCLQSAGLEGHPEYADVLVVQGEAHGKAGCTEAALQLLEDARRRRERLYGRRHVLTRDVQTKLNKLS